MADPHRKYDYIVVLKKDSRRFMHRISLGVYLISGLIFFLESQRLGQGSWMTILGLLVMILGAVFSLWPSRRASPFLYNPWMLLAGVFWLRMPSFWWVALLFFGLAFLQYQSEHPLQVGFTPEEVRIHSLFSKSYAWSDFNQIILKDGLLTLDFRNNRIFQRESTEEEDPEAEEDEFNEYCQRMLKMGRIGGTF